MLRLRYPGAIQMSLAQKIGVGFIHEFSTIGIINREEPPGQSLCLQNLKIIYRESLAKETLELPGLAELQM